MAATVSLRDVLIAVTSGSVRLAPESTGYLVLAAADALVHTASDDETRRVVSAQAFILSEEGDIRTAHTSYGMGAQGEQALRELLRALLQASGTSTPALWAVAQRGSGPGLRTLVKELEGALIPVNRTAATRALSRLCRDTQRALATEDLSFAEGALSPEPSMLVQSLRVHQETLFEEPTQTTPSGLTPVDLTLLEWHGLHAAADGKDEAHLACVEKEAEFSALEQSPTSSLPLSGIVTPAPLLNEPVTVLPTSAIFTDSVSSRSMRSDALSGTELQETEVRTKPSSLTLLLFAILLVLGVVLAALMWIRFPELFLGYR